MSNTQDNLQEAFAGESQANRTYLAFARKAEEDGFPQVAKLFRAAADSETVHALAHFKVMDKVKSTAENLKASVHGENYEHTSMYPAFVEQAKEEGQKEAMMSFNYAMQVEVLHEELYSQALEAVSGGKDLPSQDLNVCQYCGYVAEGEAPKRCPVCGRPHEMFKKV
ncbi:MAG: rubrerythrin family protein [Candidatus Methanomethylophilaceae archaeon]|jgi:rubrerythrin